MSQSDKFIQELQSTSDSNVFVMMRYANTPLFDAIERAVRTTLEEYGLIARLAKDRALSEDLWENIRLYMGAAQYGIAIFEEIDQRDFNPNISLELGYMYALNRRCLLLKDKRMPRLPTDTCGKIYKDFDTYDGGRSVARQVKAWCESDLGLALVSLKREGPVKTVLDRLIYDGPSDETFSKWGRFDSSRFVEEKFRILQESERPSGSPAALEIRAVGTEFVGMNLKVDALLGAFTVEYKAVSSKAAALNLYFCVIPMKGLITDLWEVGAARVDDPLNASSPYRIKHFIPHHHIGDDEWHTTRLEFDFGKTPTASYSICGIRINEGCPRPAEGVLQVRNARVTTSCV